METLYDLLGALPRDDAEELRAAFRRAVKGAHPDLNPGDPDAGVKFREIVRANEILGDQDQRAAYDHLLVLADKEKKRQANAKMMHSAATGIMALAIATGLCTTGYLGLREPALAQSLQHLADIAIARPADFARLTPPVEAKPQPVIIVEAKADIPPPPQGSPVRSPEPPPAVKQETAANIPSDVIVPVVVTPSAETTIANVGPPLELVPNDARGFRERGVSAYHNGDYESAMSDFDRAIQLDPKFSAAYIDRGILLYRMQQFDRAYADIAHAKRIERAKTLKAAKEAAKKPKPPQAALVLGLPPFLQRRTAKLE